MSDWCSTVAVAVAVDGSDVKVPFCRKCCKSLASCSSLCASLPYADSYWPVPATVGSCLACGSAFCSAECLAKFQSLYTPLTCCKVAQVQSLASACEDESVKALTRLSLTMLCHAISRMHEHDEKREVAGAAAAAAAEEHPFTTYCGASDAYLSIPNISSLSLSPSDVVSSVHSLLSSPPSIVSLANPSLYCALAVIASRNSILLAPQSPFVEYYRDVRRKLGRDSAAFHSIVSSLASALRLVESSSSSSSSASETVVGVVPALDRNSDAQVYSAVGVRVGSLFSLTSKLNHSCNPNCLVECGFRDAVVDIIASRDVQEGEELMIGYVDVNKERAGRRAWNNRRQELFERYV